MTFITQQKEITIKTIVLESIRKIMELSSEEFRGGYEERTYSGNSFTDKYVPDSRKKVIQIIEYLCSLVKPKFDKIMKEKYISILQMQKDNYKTNAIENNDSYIVNKLKLMRELFDEINDFFERTNYFKGEVYHESGEDNE